MTARKATATAAQRARRLDLRTLVARLAALDEAEQARLVATLSPGVRRTLMEAWDVWHHDGQGEPPGEWRVWLIRAGRGFGKTRAGAEWISAVARQRPDARIALVGHTADDVRQVMIEGASGLIAVARDDERIDWRSSTGELRFASGARATVFSAEAPDRLRGPEHDVAWCDELAKWKAGGDLAWDNLLLGLRLGDRPRALVTTTPRPTPLMRRVLALPGLVETRGGTADNPHLPAGFAGAMAGLYAGTRLGRQELDGELVDDVEQALWPRALIEAARATPAALARVERVRTVIGVDPPAGSEAPGGGDACGIVAVTRDAAGIGWVIEDASVAGASPDGWARAVVACAARHRADRVVAERNQGGEMVRHTLTAVEANLPLTLVHAHRGKAARAEPVAALYERGRVRHAGVFRQLEDELCGLQAGGGYQGPGRSPDRADAMVHAFTELMLAPRGVAAVRVL